jgi:hypothetical protein
MDKNGKHGYNWQLTCSEKKKKLMTSGNIDEFKPSKTQTCMHKENIKTRN